MPSSPRAKPGCAKALQSFPALALYADGIGLTAVVIMITFLSLVVGELVPKRIGLGNPEGIAIVMARPMHRLSVIAGPVVRVLSLSTEALLRMLGRNPAATTLNSNGSNFGPGEIGLHPGPNGETSVLRFTAPLDGAYAITGSFFGLRTRK